MRNARQGTSDDRKPSAVPVRAPSSTSADELEEGASPAAQRTRRHSSFSRSPRDLPVAVPSGIAAGLLFPPPPLSHPSMVDPGLLMMGPGTAAAASIRSSSSRRQPSEEQLMRQAHILNQRQQQLESMLAAASTSSTAVRAPMYLPSDALLHQQRMRQQQAAAALSLEQQAAAALSLEQQSALLQQQQNAAYLQHSAAAARYQQVPDASAMSSFLLSDSAMQQQQQHHQGAAAAAASLPSTPPEVPQETQPSEAAFRRGNGVMDRSEHADRDSEGTEDGKDPSKRNSAGEIFEAFPQKLHRMIQEAEENKQEDIISFFPHGRAFVIQKPRLFVSEIMPKYFTTTRMSSFQRQLNLYGFKRITEGQDMGGYGHKYFLKSRPDLCSKIKRKLYSKNSKLVRPREPNFYSMPPVLQGGSALTAAASMDPMGGFGAGVAGLDPRITSSYAASSELMNNSLMMQNGAQLLSLQHEAAILQQEKANMMAWVLHQREREEEKE